MTVSCLATTLPPRLHRELLSGYHDRLLLSSGPLTQRRLSAAEGPDGAVDEGLKLDLVRISSGAQEGVSPYTICGNDFFIPRIPPPANLVPAAWA
ncbi:hypothetical protein A0H81_10188 [Grifola frondosa]|uniref:Uncharacterized protein n=1 Tax=Grifola frondosa TaxID=5627 RepID=A0A1C7LZ17_GRIFR|nr:hypothetical protein A0H81_10188 [Grifola frondosa]